MRSRTAQWFETKVKYDKMMEDGSQKKVPELYVVDALSFTEAEESITEEASHYSTGEFDVTDIKKAPYGEIFFTDNPQDDKWYKTKVLFIVIDEKTGKEKYSGVNYLVQANSLQNAVKNIEEVLNTGMQDWKIASVAETMILDVYEHQGKPTGSKEEPQG
ncbi:MAG: DUF4494 domain-containing protein [Prevotella sp.]|nr:DUF4494 domain-containing protein [Prevotella sp.]